MNQRRSRTAAVACLLAATLLAGCRDGRSPAPSSAGGRGAGEVVVASFNFPESTLLAEIYARAIEATGIPVRRELNLGPRELVQPALLQGLVDVVPEYLGTATASLVPGEAATPGDAADRLKALAGALEGWGVRVLDLAPAQDQNGFAVTRATADRYHLSTIGDLAAVAGGLTLGGPPECPQRPYCLEGLERVYGLRFGSFVALDTEQQRATALADGVVDVAVLFTTDGRLAGQDLALLDDDRALQPPENVVPVVSSRAIDRFGPRLVDAVNAVSSQLTSNALLFLNWRVDVAGKDMASEAGGWLERQGLAPRR